MGNVTEVQKEVLSKIDANDEGSPQLIHPRSSLISRYAHERYQMAPECDEASKGDVLPECGERNLVIYHINRMIRDLYINSNKGGKSGAYRKQCRIKRKSALQGLATRSEHVLGFRWSARAIGFDPDILRNRIIFDVQSVTSLLCSGVKIRTSNEQMGISRKAMVEAEIWLWDEAPERYHLSEKKGQYIIKMHTNDAKIWLNSLIDSPLQFDVEEFELTTGLTILILKHK